MYSVHNWEDSGKETLPMGILSLFLNHRSVIQNFKFMFKYMGQYLIILGIWHILFIVMVVVFRNLYSILYMTQVSEIRERDLC